MNQTDNTDYLRDPDSKCRHNEQLFSRIAARYDLLNKILSFGADRKWKRLAVSMLPLTDVTRCLDLACGTGDMALLLAEKYPQADIVGLDLSRNMIECAQKRKGGKNIELITGDMCAIPFDDNIFDIVTASYAIRNAPDLNRCLGEIIRVTRPGGYVCLMDFSKPANKFLQKLELLFIKLWFGLWSWLFYLDTQPYGYVAKSLSVFPDSRQLKTILSQTGFDIKESKRPAFGMVEMNICRKLEDFSH
jgi:demethylmenaquinone methyltransferase/2-methoxy-6-polyprenyl-1,4-benzoquinol methylase